MYVFMEYVISRHLSGLKVKSESETYHFQNKLFSLSSALSDNSGKIIASLKRNSWLRMSFLLSTTTDQYIFHSKAFDSKLLCNSTKDEFYTHGSIEFYSSKGLQVTKLSKIKKSNMSYRLTIEIPEHEYAFIIASCIIYKTVIESSSFAWG